VAVAGRGEAAVEVREAAVEVAEAEPVAAVEVAARPEPDDSSSCPNR